jgi:hypothetical protein
MPAEGHLFFLGTWHHNFCPLPSSESPFRKLGLWDPDLPQVPACPLLSPISPAQSWIRLLQ